jgi:hypothetical protein
VSKPGFCRDCQWWNRNDNLASFHQCDAPESENNKNLFMFAIQVDGYFESDASLTVKLMTGPESGFSRYKPL